MYKYETHLHTLPVSVCAKVPAEACVPFYKELGYDGIFVTNHFIRDSREYEKQLRFYCSDYKAAKAIGDQIGLKVFFGIELTVAPGTDFLIYGLDEGWYLNNPQIIDMPTRKKLSYMMDAGALIIQAHPYREAGYIDHIRLFPRNVHGVEVYNANRTELENRMAQIYGENYGLLPFAGSDNHRGPAQMKLGGMEFPTPIIDEVDFANRIKAGEGCLFRNNLEDFSCNP